MVGDSEWSVAGSFYAVSEPEIVTNLKVVSSSSSSISVAWDAPLANGGC